jgi:UDP-N-acetylmuramate dehydrogenase
MKLQENVPLAPLTTFGVGGPARYFVEAHDIEEVREAALYARQHNLRLFVMGGGSNLVVAEAGWAGLVVKIGLRGVESQTDAEIGKRVFEVAAGEDWDGFIAQAVEAGCAGVETLSGIPGTVGGTPVQNVGAYGQDVSQTILWVRVLDLFTLEVKELDNAECEFGYRRSRFNSAERDRFIVLAVCYALAPGGKPNLTYADVKKYFGETDRVPSLKEVREAVRAIRHTKAMLIVADDPDCRSAGSFFKNPVVPVATYEAIATHYAERSPGTAVPNYPAKNGFVKLPAAWLVEQAGFSKGYARGPAAISTKHTLAIVNRGGAKASDILGLRDEVLRGVKEKFGIELQQEPVLVGF